MDSITVNTNRATYDVHIGVGAFKLFGTRYKDLLQGFDKLVVIADEHVAALHLDQLLNQLEPIVGDLFVKLIPSGEASKSIETYYDCHTFLLNVGCTRKSGLIAFGGGACGDLTGFVASTFMRGIRFIQCPTTILAHDSAVGGKTAINHPEGKNMIGAFYQPSAVIYEIGILNTLSEKEIRSGMAEVIKHALISNLQWLEELMEVESFKGLSSLDLERHLKYGIAVKAAIVEEDEREQSVRKYLNFGHTYGHAIEAAIGYGKITHGEAIMLGMVYELIASEKYGHIGRDFTDSFLAYGKKLGYPFEVLKDLPFNSLLKYMLKDKKASFGEVQFALLDKIGNPFLQVIDTEMMGLFDREFRERVREIQ